MTIWWVESVISSQANLFISGKLFTNITNNIGPNRNPCGVLAYGDFFADIYNLLPVMHPVNVKRDKDSR